MQRPHVAIFSPLPPSKSGIADYTSELAGELSRHVDATYVVDRSADLDAIRAAGFDHPVAALDAWNADGANADTIRLYHLGNNPHHEYVLKELLRRPGIAVMHDLVLHHLIAHVTIDRGDLAGYAEFLRDEYGELGARTALQRAAGLFSETQQFLLPLIGRAAACAASVIVHSEWARKRVLQYRPGCAVTRIPHHLGPPPRGFREDGRAAARRRLGLPDSATILASLGFITRPKQIDAALRAIRQILSGQPAPDRSALRYVLAGETTPDFDVNSAIRQHGLEDVAQVAGHVELVDFHDYIQAADVVINLRYPSAGETSGTLIRAMGMGRCCVVYDYGPFADFPTGTVAAVPIDDFSAAVLRDTLLDLIANPPRREQVASAAREHIHTTNSIQHSAGAYARVIHRAAETP
jgi:glycosyltransferase involved in cell wall biosynthesis